MRHCLWNGRHAAVLEALIGRSVTGKGRRLEVSLFDGMADWMNVPLLYYEGTGKSPRRVGLNHPSICPYGVFETRDGELVLISIQNEREWAQLCSKVLDEPELVSTSGFETNTIRVANREVVDRRIAATMKAMSRSEAAARLKVANIAFGFVNELPDLQKHPALRRTAVWTPQSVAHTLQFISQFHPADFARHLCRGKPRMRGKSGGPQRDRANPVPLAHRSARRADSDQVYVC
jgi:crotonobetainyl-CoA:carnitine CoA-transferase CaiB-like acyl-CoA transferase